MLRKILSNFLKGGYMMPAIKPVSDLRDYNKVLRECKANEPVYLTKNGHGAYVLLGIEDYEKMMEALISAIHL